MNLLIRWQRSPKYWRLRQLLSKLYFNLSRLIFSYRLDIRDMQENISITNTVAKSILWKTIISLAVVVILERLEYFLERHWELISSIMEINQVALVGQSFPYDTLFGAIAGLTGLFLGLYFAAISSLISGVYSTHPGTLLSVFLRERAGRHYIGVLAFTAVYSIILLCYISLGQVPGIMNTIVVTVFCCYGIYSFARLGTRIFAFFDPAQLAHTIFTDIHKSIKSSTIEGFAWKDSNYQAYYHRQAKQGINTLSVLVRFCFSSEQPPENSLLEALKGSVNLIIEYQKEKAHIPSESNWYTQHYDHQNWFLANASQLDIALRTATALQPKLKSDNYWLEQQILDIILLATKDYLKRDDVESTYLVLYNINILLQEFGSKLELKQAIKLINTIETMLDEYIDQMRSEGKDDVLSTAFWMALVDCYGLMYISSLLGFFNEFGADPKGTIQKLMESVNWNSPKGAYESNFPYRMLERLEYVFEHLKFEKSVEEQIISPSWYRDQLIIGRFAELVDEASSDLVTMGVEFYRRKTELFYQQKQYAACVLLGHRGLEWCRKADYQINNCPVMSDMLNEYHVLKELLWPTWQWENLRNQISNLEKDIYKVMARCLPLIVESSKDGKFPDLFGKTYHMILLEIYQFLKVTDTKAVKELIPLFFVSVFQAHEGLRKKTAGWTDPKSSLIFSSEPIADLMELSGYALVYSELYEIPELWDLFKTCWDPYFDSCPDKTQAAQYLNNLNRFRKSIHGFTPHSLIYSSWKSELEQLLKSKGLITNNSYPRQKQKLLHKSPLIRALSSSNSGFHCTCTELFLLVYVADRPESATLSFNDRFGFKKQWEREINSSKDKASEVEERQTEEQDTDPLVD